MYDLALVDLSIAHRIFEQQSRPMQSLFQWVTVVALATTLAGCAERAAAIKPPPAPRPLEGQLAVSLASPLRVGENRLRFAVVQARSPAPRLVLDPSFRADVRFFHDRPPVGDPDASSPAAFVGTNARPEADANFVANLYLPQAGGGSLQFVIRDPKGVPTVINMPVRVDAETPTAP